MKAFTLLVAVAAVVVSANAKAASIQEKHPIDWYDCSGKRDGNYIHPSDCTRFISCSGGIASERDCASCTVNPRNCPDGRLVYNSTEDACLWADETECKVGGGGGGSGEDGEATTEQPGSGESSEGPGSGESSEGPGSGEGTEGPVPTDGPGSGESSEGPGSGEGTEGPVPTEGPGSGESSEGPGEGTEGPVPTTEAPGKPPVEGDPCDPEECQNVGWCQSYLRCDKDSGKLVKEECGDELVWNPRNPNGTSQVHGGNCDKWENLDDDIEREYRSTKECLGCFWEEIGSCNREYLYQPAHGRHRNVLRLSCAEGLVFSEAKESCVRCQDARDKDNNDQPCC